MARISVAHVSSPASDDLTRIEDGIMADGDPIGTIQDITWGFQLPRCLYVIAELGVADALGDAPLTPAALADAVGANADALMRMIRLLSANGVFEFAGGMVQHNAASRLLREDHPQSMRGFVRNNGAHLNWQAYEAIEHTARTGRPATEKVAPQGIWAFRQEDAGAGRLFDAAMQARARGHISAVIPAYDFSRFDSIADIGGGRGHLLAAVLASAPKAKGVLFDQPHVVSGAVIEASERVTLQGGSFFEDALPVCDGYLLMEVIHDWADDEALAILKAVRRAAPANARVLLIEAIIPDEPGPAHAKTLDVHMMVMNGGRQRSLAEYESLLSRAGFAFERAIPAGAQLSIIEAVPAA
jgi:hypothetical protein